MWFFERDKMNNTDFKCAALTVAMVFSVPSAIADDVMETSRPAILGTNAVALGQKSTAIGKEALAVGNGADEQDVRVLIERSQEIQNTINTLQAAIDKDKSNPLLHALSDIERNQKRIDELTVTLNENQKQLEEKEAFLAQKTKEYNDQKAIVDQKAHILSSLSTGEFVTAWVKGGIDELAKVTKERVEAGTSINNSLDFYRDYVENFVDSSTVIKGVENEISTDTNNQKPFPFIFDSVFRKPDNLFIIEYSEKDSPEELTQRLKKAESFDVNKQITDTITEVKNNISKIQEMNVRELLMEEVDKNIYTDKLKWIYQGVIDMTVTDINHLLQLKKVNGLSKNDENYPVEFKKLLDLESAVQNVSKKYNRPNDENFKKLTSAFWWISDTNVNKILEKNIVENIKNKNVQNSNKILIDLNSELKTSEDELHKTEAEVNQKIKEVNGLKSSIDTLKPSDEELANVEKSRFLTQSINENIAKISAKKSELSDVQKEMNNGTGATALGDNSIAIGKNSVALGNDTIARRENSVDVGNRQITSLADATEKNDAVNKGQLDKEKDARVDGDKATLEAAKQNTAEREIVINQRTDGLLNTERNARIEGDRATLAAAKQNTAEREIAINQRTDGLIQNEAEARINGDRLTLYNANRYTDRSIESMGSQISSEILEKSKNYADNKFKQLNERINRVEKRINAGIAGVMAVSSIPYIAENGFSYGIALGGYQNSNAIAAGIQYKTSLNTNVRLNVSWDSAHNSAFGVGFAGGW